MDKFTTVTSVAAPLPTINVDTDMIIPARYLKTITRKGLGEGLFYAQRFTPEGKENPDFVLNKPAYRQSKILVAGPNFGCGSSREHAPWALLDFGIRVIIAPSYADIFHANCFKNGILPITLPQAVCDQLMDDARKGANARLTVDLKAQTITRPDGSVVKFDIDPYRRDALLDGIDEIGLTEQKRVEITSFEDRNREAQPWLWTNAR
jgi:3-isopropylmalate/(R)-2-methylmalate dehydratase small subunit